MPRKEYKEVLVVVDIECTGPCPGLNSMISIGAVACEEADNEEGYNIIDTYFANLEELDDTWRNEQTMEFWARFPEAWKASTENARPAEEVMQEFKKWATKVSSGRGRPVFVGYPAGFDWPFVYYYMHRFTDSCVFGFQALDMKSYAHAIMGKNFRYATKRNMPKEWFSKLPHTHIASDDAKEQAHLFFQMRKAANNLRKESK